MLMYFVGHEFRRDTAEIACFCFTMSEVSAREGLNNWAWIKPHWRLQPSGGFSTYMSGPWAEMTWKLGSDSSTNQSPTHGLSKWLEHGGRWVVRLLRWWLWAYECTFQQKRRKPHGLLRPSLGNHIVSLLRILLLNPVRKPPRFKWRTIPWPGGGSKNSSHALKQPKEEWFSSHKALLQVLWIRLRLVTPCFPGDSILCAFSSSHSTCGKSFPYMRTEGEELNFAEFWLITCVILTPTKFMLALTMPNPCWE